MEPCPRSIPKLLLPDESAWSFLQRAQSKPIQLGVPLLDQQLNVKNGDLIELHGAAQSGKTEWCLLAVSHALLPAQCAGLDIGGRGVSAVYFTNDAKFYLWRLLQIMESRMLAAARDHLPPGADADALYARYGGKAAFQEIVRGCLAHLTLYRCRDGPQFCCTLLAVAQALKRGPEAPEPEVRLVVVDPIGPGAFYWPDKLLEPFAPSCTGPLELLKSLYSCVILVTTGPTSHGPAEQPPAAVALAALPHRQGPAGDWQGVSQPLPAAPYREVGLPERSIKYRVLLGGRSPAFACRVTYPAHLPLANVWVAFQVGDQGVAF